MCLYILITNNESYTFVSEPIRRILKPLLEPIWDYAVSCAVKGSVKTFNHR